MATNSPNTTGHDFNFFQQITVTDTAFPSAAQIGLNIRSIQTFSLLNLGDITIEYSFNGNTLHGNLIPDTPCAGIFFDNRTIGKVWLRLTSPGASDLRFEAWSKM